MNPSPEIYAPSILIVDDTPSSLRLLDRMLSEQGYTIRTASCGEQALSFARSDPPDLVLLDIDMPGMDGYDVCERLKADEILKEIPVIFISALAETANIVRGFDAGGVDYIVKPFNSREVQARVKTHLEIVDQKQQLQINYEKLRQLESLRDNMVNMIAHDMRNPLMGISASLQVLERIIKELSSPEGAESIRTAKSALHMLLEMVNSMLDVSRMESGQMKLNFSEFELVDIAKYISVGTAPIGTMEWCKTQHSKFF